MATIDEILAAMPEPAAEAANDFLVIDPDSRTIYVPESETVFGVEADTNAERKYFTCPRYVGDNIDLASCFLRVNFRNANNEEDSYLVDDVTATADAVAFSWRLSDKVTAYKGQVQFKVHADTGNGQDWGTTLATGEVLEGLEPDHSTVEAETSDVVTQLLALVDRQTTAVEAAGADQIVAINRTGAEATQEARDAILERGAAVLETIPDDYRTLAGTVDRLTRDRAAAIVCEAEGTAIQVTDASADPLQGLRLFGRSTQDGTPTPDAPVAIESVEAPVVTVHGKNLLPFPYEDGDSKTMNGITYTVRPDGSILVNGTATANSNFTLAPTSHVVSLPKGWACTSLGIGYGNDIVQIQNDIYQDGVYLATLQTSLEKAAKRNFSKRCELRSSRIKVDAGVTVNNVLVYPVFCLSEYPAPYEPGRKGQTLTIPHTLRGIPVASGGNYTDADGQQWVCDEVDLARGVYVQRVGEFEPTGAEAWGVSGKEFYCALPTYSPSAGDTVQCICSHYPAKSRYELSNGSSVVGYWGISVRDNYVRLVDNVNYSGDVVALKAYLAERVGSGLPVTVLYQLATPIETALTVEELQAFKALHTNKPTTTVLNDAGAWMAVDYSADAKLYIDRRIAEMLSAL